MTTHLHADVIMCMAGRQLEKQGCSVNTEIQVMNTEIQRTYATVTVSKDKKGGGLFVVSAEGTLVLKTDTPKANSFTL